MFGGGGAGTNNGSVFGIGGVGGVIIEWFAS
jgi:hypothetical protein